ncbi:MAG: SUF system NifU family Fe-S cluster assembly protein [Candidatus Izimaplasma sp.]|nr:SUF system NifU family Fe-S cluster assembly protein [Candidatus Izimaplasma bacterium]
MDKLERLYRQVIMEHYKNPRNKGLKNKDGYHKVHIKNPSCGDDITVETKVEDGIVKEVNHEGSGCSICCSSASVMSETLKNKPVEKALQIKDEYLKMLMDKDRDETVELEDAIAYVGVKKFPARIKCASIAWKAFERAIKESE